MGVSSSKNDNLLRACRFIAEAAKNGAKIVTLPECFNSPYGTSYFPEYAETIPGQTTEVLSCAAKENKVFLIGGSLPEKDGDKYYNSCPIYNNEGTMVHKFRKLHLFDIDIPGKITFKESSVLTQGNSLATLDTVDNCKVGVGICYDMRFPELAQIYSKRGCRLLIYPGAFNMTTGPSHWELLQRARALDNQVYVAACSPARNEESTYIAWGHSMVVSPWGDIIAKCGYKEEIIYADLDMSFLDGVRSQIPLTKQKRDDLYSVQDGST